MFWLYKAPYKKLIFISLLVYLVTAYFSVGYYHPDEHFQILEFCNYKLGNSQAVDLPWEFHEKIRPALQPALAFVMIKLFNAVSINNPFTYSLIFRILTAIVSWFVICKISLLLINNFSSDAGKKIFLFLSLLSGFFPFLSVRFSSENYAAITFLGVLYFVIKHRFVIAQKIQWQLIFAGLLSGFSFFFRFQIAFAIIGLGLWLVIINKTKWGNLIILVASGIVAIIICVLVDYWFYGKFEFTPYNYFFTNLIQNKAPNFGVEPWWFYFTGFVNKVFLPFGILLMLFFFFGLFKSPKDVFVWCIIPFLIAHFAIAHKELRFLFPIVFGFIYLASFGIEYIIKVLKIQKFGTVIFILIVALNVPSLLGNMVLPADKTLYFYKYLHERLHEKATVLISRDIDICGRWGLKFNFYDSPNIKCVELTSDDNFNNYLNSNTADTLYVLERKVLPEIKYNGYNSKCVCAIYPDWILWFNVNNWESRTGISNIRELTKIVSSN